ncbi:MAG: YwmB family TATA-box binding protein [Clostridium sp.]|uniref:YwmB family TATA-box binding protein n=1 Tax=Clostridium sp. TaxID=1506 RepID=UPI002A8B894C|nr:YwmB family TATA-box binding protein [Clostridium sp.]MDY5099571.1 YwmB family TATA-box binding protein [Clostridium sp.]
MRNKFMLITFLIFTLFSTPKSTEDFIDGAVKSVDGTVIENGSRIEITNIKNFNVRELDDVLAKHDENKVKISIDEEALELEGRVIINTTSKDNSFSIDNLNKDILKEVTREDRNIKVFSYVKAQLREGDVELYKNNLEKYLINTGGKNIKFSSIDSGVTGVALANMDNSEELDNNLFNINFALVKYTSGTYIIVGTPIITCAY